MTQKHIWYLSIILFVVAFSIYNLTPPTNRDLLRDFQDQARNPGTPFSNIVARAQELQKQYPARGYGNLKDAIGTNEIVRYFPHISAKGEKNPSAFVLAELQR